MTLMPVLARSQPVTTAERLDAIERTLAAVLAGQARIVALLGRGHGARSLTARDARLLDAIASNVGGETVFGASELFRHAEVVDGGLRAAFADSRLKDANALGRRLTRISRHCAGLVRVGRDAGGLLWCVTRPDATTSDHHARR